MKPISLVLTGDPKSTQHCYKYACINGYLRSYLDKKCVDIKEGYQWEAKSQYFGDPLKGKLWIVVRLFHKTKRAKDIDNYNKLLFDSLNGVVYDDDVQIVKLHLSKDYDKENPRIEIDIYESV